MDDGGSGTYAAEDVNSRNDFLNTASTVTEDSSTVAGLSEFTADDTSLSASSLEEVGSDSSSFLEKSGNYGTNSSGILSTLSHETKHSLVEGWFDTACGWLDRPNLCVANAGPSTSLLKESHIKKSKVMGRMKMSTLLKTAAMKSSPIGFEKKIPSNEKKSKDSDARIESSTMIQNVDEDIVQPSQKDEICITEDFASNSESELINDCPSNVGVKGHKSINSNSKENSVIQAKMDEVSARATEILKSSLDLSTLADGDIPMAWNSVDLGLSKPGTVSDDPLPSTSIATDSLHEENKNESVLRSQVYLGHPTNFDLTSKDDKSQIQTVDDRCLDPSLSITDLTHVADGADHGGLLSGGSNDIVKTGQVEGLRERYIHETATSTAASMNAMRGKHKGVVEIIPVFEDDDDSWTPVESNNLVSSSSQNKTINEPQNPNKARTMVEQNSEGSSTTQGARRRGERLLAAEDSNIQIAPTTTRDQTFSDPHTRESFLGLRRGRLMTSLGDNEQQRVSSPANQSLAAPKQGARDTHFGINPTQMKGQNHIRPSEHSTFFRHPEAGGVEPQRRHDVGMTRERRDLTVKNSHRDTSPQPADASINQGLENRPRQVMGSSRGELPEPSSLTGRGGRMVHTHNIDDAQRERAERNRDLSHSDALRAENREGRRLQGMKSYGYSVPASKESPINVHEYYMSSKSGMFTQQDQSPQSFHQRYDRTYLEGRRDQFGRSGRSQGLYNSIIINRSKSRDGGVGNRSDKRDDSNAMFNQGRQDPSGRVPLHLSSTSHRDRAASRPQQEGRHQRHSSRRPIDDNREEHWHDEPYDVKPAMSVREISSLEQKFDENRAAKLQRLRSRHISSSQRPSYDNPMERSSMRFEQHEYAAEKSRQDQLKSFRDSRHIAKRQTNAY